MDSKHPIDQFVRQKMAERSFDYDPAYWEAAQELIAAEEQKKRRGLFWWWGLGALVLLFSAGLVWAWPQLMGTEAAVSAGAAGTGMPAFALAWSVDTLCPGQTDCPPEIAPHLGTRPLAQTVASGHNEAPRPSATHSPIPTSHFLPPASLNSTTDIGSPKALSHFSAPGQPLSRLTSPPTSVSRGENTRLAPTPDRSDRQILTALGKLPLRIYRLAFAPSAVNTLAPIPPSRWQSPRQSLRLEIGISLNQQWGGQTDTVATGLNLARPNLHAGLSYTRKLNRRIAIQTGLRYRERRGLGLEQRVRQTTLGFGFNTEELALRPISLHTLTLPLSLQYFLGSRHTIEAGLSVHRLLNVRSTLQRRQLSDGSDEFEMPTRVWGYRAGFQPWDLGLRLGYQVQVSPRFFLGLEGHYGMRHLSLPATFGPLPSSRNHQLSLRLGYELWRR